MTIGKRARKRSRTARVQTAGMSKWKKLQVMNGLGLAICLMDEPEEGESCYPVDEAWAIARKRWGASLSPKFEFLDLSGDELEGAIRNHFHWLALEVYGAVEAIT